MIIHVNNHLKMLLKKKNMYYIGIDGSEYQQLTYYCVFHKRLKNMSHGKITIISIYFFKDNINGLNGIKKYILNR